MDEQEEDFFEQGMNRLQKDWLQLNEERVITDLSSNIAVSNQVANDQHQKEMDCSSLHPRLSLNPKDIVDPPSTSSAATLLHTDDGKVFRDITNVAFTAVPLDMPSSLGAFGEECHSGPSQEYYSSNLDGLLYSSSLALNELSEEDLACSVLNSDFTDNASNFKSHSTCPSLDVNIDEFASIESKDCVNGTSIMHENIEVFESVSSDISSVSGKDDGQELLLVHGKVISPSKEALKEMNRHLVNENARLQTTLKSMTHNNKENEVHSVKVENRIVFSCNNCSKSFKSLFGLQQHRKQVHNEAKMKKVELPCPHCPGRFACLDVHIRQRHKETLEQECPVCHFRTSDMRRHRGNCIFCPNNCPDNFNSKRLDRLLAHMKVCKGSCVPLDLSPRKDVNDSKMQTSTKPEALSRKLEARSPKLKPMSPWISCRQGKLYPALRSPTKIHVYLPRVTPQW